VQLLSDVSGVTRLLVFTVTTEICH